MSGASSKFDCLLKVMVSGQPPSRRLIVKAALSDLNPLIVPLPLNPINQTIRASNPA